MSVRKLLFAAVTTVLSLGIAIALVEIGVRVALDDGMDYTLEMWKYARAMKRIARDPALAHEHVPGATARLMGVDVTINSHKLRDREIPFEKSPGTTRILMLGDSLTFGWGVNFEATSSKVLERELNAVGNGRMFEVINAGVGNYNTSMEVQYFFNEGVRYSPDVVVLNYFINDAEPTPRYTGNFMNEHFQSWVILGARLDTLLRTIHSEQRWDQYYEALYADDAPGWAEARSAVGRLAAWCRNQGIPCILANQPELRRLDPYPFSAISEKLARLASEQGLLYLDLLGSVSAESADSLWVTVEDPHPNDKACTLFGKAIAGFIAGQIMPAAIAHQE